jgi:hypothetical protein
MERIDLLEAVCRAGRSLTATARLSRAAAESLCSRLRAVGGSCVVQRI